MNQSKQVAMGMRGSSCWFMPSSPFPPLEITRVSTLQTFASSNLQYDFDLCTRGAITRCRNAYAFRRRFVAPTHHRKRPGPESAVPQTPAINNHTAWTRGPPRASLPSPCFGIFASLVPDAQRNSHRPISILNTHSWLLIPPGPRPPPLPNATHRPGPRSDGSGGRRPEGGGAGGPRRAPRRGALRRRRPPPARRHRAPRLRKQVPRPPACCPPSAAASSSTLGIEVSRGARVPCSQLHVTIGRILRC